MRIIVLVLVPVIALIGLYAVALSLTLSSFLSLKQSADVRNEVTNPATNVQLQLSRERGVALQYLADPTHARLLLLLAQEPKTDAAVNGYLGAAAKTNPGAGIGERRASEKWAAELGTLHALRTTVVSVGMSRAAAAASYSALIAGADYVLTQAVLPVLNTAALIQANDILTMEESLQATAEERDLFAADLTTHSYPTADNKLISQLMVERRELWNQATSSLDKPYLTLFTTDIPGPTMAALTSLESQILSSPHNAMRISVSAWTSVNSAFAAGFRKALYSSSTSLRASGFAEARNVLIRLILIGGLGLIAIVAAIAIAIVLSRVLLQQLDDLRLSALELSSVRLPAVLARLRSGDEIDASTETPQLDPGSNEIGQLGRAFNIAAQAAVAAAVDEADIRRGVNDVFRNLARRNQSLLTRQLELLDAMERRVHDPEELADLFRVDHLTTRMRRHAEGLLIVAGGSSGRVWREPVPIVDVMRAAVAEIEDYTRIRVTTRSSSSVAGHAVADIIHMLAELVENATTFSPANTPVRIESDNVAKGLIVEIEDRGLGMTDKQLEEINSKLSDPPLLDLSGSEQLGLFIAGQLARRHDVKITMRGSAYGGITAVVLIPTGLVIDPGYDEPLTVVGIRELGGRPVPQLPAASPTDEEIAASVNAIAGPDYVSTTGYLLDLEASAGPVTTTAAQIDTPQAADADQINLDRAYGGRQLTADSSGSYSTGSYGPAYETGTYDAEAYSSGSFGAEAYGTGSYGTGSYDTSSYDTSSYGTSSYGTEAPGTESYAAESYGTGSALRSTGERRVELYGTGPLGQFANENVGGEVVSADVAHGRPSLAGSEATKADFRSAVADNADNDDDATVKEAFGEASDEAAGVGDTSVRAGVSADDTSAEAAAGAGDHAASTVAGGAADLEPTGLKGAGAWLTEAEAATPLEPVSEPFAGTGLAASTAAPAEPGISITSGTLGTSATSIRPALDFGQFAGPPDQVTWAGRADTESERMTDFGPAESSAESFALPSRAASAASPDHGDHGDQRDHGDHAAGRPDGPADHSDWRHLVGGTSGRVETGDASSRADLPHHAPGSPPPSDPSPPRLSPSPRPSEPSPLTYTDSSPLPRRGAPNLDRPGNGSHEQSRDGSATDRELLLPRRQPRTLGQDLADTDSFGPVPSEPSPLELDGLPVRVRQANLAPQLRDQIPHAQARPAQARPAHALPAHALPAQAQHYVAAPEMPADQAAATTTPPTTTPTSTTSAAITTTAATAPTAAPAATGEPSPEAARNFMSALQRGWERGRSMAEQMTNEPDADGNTNQHEQ